LKHHAHGGRNPSPAEPPNHSGAYRDGRPFDTVQHLEAKLNLKPDRFTSAECFRDFGRRVEITAKGLGVTFTASPKAERSPEIREIVFGDTADYSFYRHGFLLRRRIRYRDGFPVGDPEVVFQFHDPDESTAAAMDVRPTSSAKCRIKLKMEALPLADEVGGVRLLYAHNCVLPVRGLKDSDEISMATLCRVFPALAALERNGHEKISVVHAAVVEEVSLELGQLRFGKGIVAACNVALWRTRGEHQPLVGEFTCQAKLDLGKPLHEKAKKLCEQFFVSLQFEVKDWLALGASRTEMVYHLNCQASPSDEFLLTEPTLARPAVH
jgi:hypothetical protein